jgi:hypothetical protein
MGSGYLFDNCLQQPALSFKGSPSSTPWLISSLLARGPIWPDPEYFSASGEVHAVVP